MKTERFLNVTITHFIKEDDEFKELVQFLIIAGYT
jgi:hypothetical protein